MKRLISILVIVAMMLASVLAMVPAFAAEPAEGAPLLTYNVNWKELDENGTMRAQWAYQRNDGQNNFKSKYNVTATETALTLSPIGNGENRSYYSDVMFDITADTYYEYVFMADDTKDVDAGVIFAWAADPNAFVESSRPAIDATDDVYPGVPKGAYFIQGSFGDNTNFKVHFGAPYDGGYVKFGTSTKTNVYNAKLDEDGYSTFKIVYNGLKVKMYCLNVDDQWVEFFADKDMTLVEGSKVAFGVTTWTPSYTNLKNCVLYAMNEAAVAEMTFSKDELTAKITEADLFVEADWTVDAWAPFASVLASAKETNETAVYQYQVDKALAKLTAAMEALVATATDIDAKLAAKVTEGEALVENQDLYTEASWARFAAALADAKAVSDAEDATQTAMVAAFNKLADVQSGLLTKELVAKRTYNVNWKYIVGNTTMKAQWCFDASEFQNNWNSKFTTYATENSIYALPIGNGDTRQYYSYDYMMDITENTYYEYTFSAKNDPNRPTGYAGFVIGYAIDEDAYDEGSGDFNDYVGPKMSSYFIYGAFQNKSDEGDCFQLSINYGYHANDGGYCVSGCESGTGVAKLDDDGYATYKVIYDGYNVTLLYLAEDDTFKPVFGEKVATFAEGSKVAFGIFNRNQGRNIYVKNATLVAYNDAAAEILTETATAYSVALAEKLLAEKELYTPATVEALEAALAAVKAITAETPVADADAAIAALESAIANKKYYADRTALQAAIDAANAALEGKTAADFVAKYYDPFKTAYDNAVAISANDDVLQADVDAAAKALVDAQVYLTLAGQACKVDLEAVLAKYDALVETDYKPSSWATLAAPYATAKALFDNAETTDADQDAIDAAVVALDEAITALVKRADFRKLTIAINRAEALDKADYKNWSVDEALAAAKAMATNYEATQEEIDAVIEALTAAVDELVPYRSNVLLIAPDDDYTCISNEYGENPSWYNKITDMSYHGLGNVFYYDYYKVLAAKIAEGAEGFVLGQAFPSSMKDMGIQGSADYTLRLGTNMSGGGSNRVTDGYKLWNSTTDNNLNHRANPTIINGKTYGHAFGFSFLKAPTVDSIAFYLPTNTKIVSIDVYGSVRQTLADGTVLYGKADKAAVVTDENGTQCEDSTTAEKIYLGTINVPAAEDGADNILATGDFVQAMKVDYIYFALTMAEGTGKNAYYYMCEVELYGLNEGETVDGVAVADFTAVNAAFKNYAPLVASDYTEDSWAAVEAAFAKNAAIVSSCLSAQADVTAAAAEIQGAIDALVINAADKTALDAAIAEAKKFAELEYTPNTFNPLKEALAAAEALSANADATQSDVDAATKAVNDAIAALVKRADKSALQPAIDEAKKTIDLKEYYQGNTVAWRMFENQYNKLVALLTDDNAVQADVDSAIADLAAKKAELVVTEGMTLPTEPTETDAPATDAPATDAPAADSGCGGCGSSAALSALAIVGVIGTAVVLKKKED